jgi:tricorn protease
MVFDNRSRVLWLGAVLLGRLHCAEAVNSQDTLLLSQPALSRTHIAFIYDGDVWIADRDGSHSRRLTTAPGTEARPRFSQDGQSIAFSANYDGNVDVYIMPVSGGSPKRLTWHSARLTRKDRFPSGCPYRWATKHPFPKTAQTSPTPSCRRRALSR